VSTEGKFNKAVLVYRFKALQRLTTPPKDAFNKRQDEVLVDCSGKTLGIVTSRFFEDEKLASSFSLKASDVKFNPSAPGTMTETVILAVCAVKPS
jgi:hypothetical protein